MMIWILENHQTYLRTNRYHASQCGTGSKFCGRGNPDSADFQV